MRKILFASLLILIKSSIYGQILSSDIVAAAGDYFRGLKTSISWTLGEPAIETFISGHTVITQGFQQVFSEITPINEAENINEYDFKIDVYPNPTIDLVRIEISGFNISGFSLSIYDIFGKEIISYDLKPENSIQCFIIKSVDLKPYSQGNYFLKINSTGQAFSKLYKIVKY